MPLSPQVHQQLTDALIQKVGRVRPCPVCGQDQHFQLLTFVVNLHFSESPSSFEMGPSYATHLVLACAKCGNTHLLNVNILGVLSILEVRDQTVQEVPPDASATDA
jgi:hypothetical protein